MSKIALVPRLLVLLLAGLGFASVAQAAEIELKPVAIPEAKAVYGRIESRFVIPARARLGGVLVELSVAEGSAVAAGQVVARIVDDKLALQVAAIDARIRAAGSELANARAEFERVQSLMARGATTQQRIDQARTQVDVLVNQVAQANAERSVILQQASEGDVLAPAAGRVLTVPARRGAVVMPGEPVATVAGGGLYLRLAIPERHAATLTAGARVQIGEHGGTGLAALREGRIEKLYPQIEAGRVIVDVAADGLPDVFVGERVLVRVPIGVRQALMVPERAVSLRAGLDLVRIATAQGQREVAVIAGEVHDTPDGRLREILTGLKPGDRVVAP